jgi:negative regulator of sigma-B (phosphoserine phosphatase)
MRLASGLATATLAGQESSGDRAVVLEFAGGAVVAAIDGLGHGTQACIAADAAVEALSVDPSVAVEELVLRCHHKLRHTRGAVMTLASFRGNAMTWVGVGNVEGLLVRPDVAVEAVAMRGGIIGYQLPTLAARRHQVAEGDTLVLATDGIRHGFRGEVDDREPQAIADAVLAKYGKGNDDACVIVARVVGGTA